LPGRAPDFLETALFAFLFLSSASVSPHARRKSPLGWGFRLPLRTAREGHSGGTPVDLGEQRLNLRAAAKAATDLAQVAERV
jgi:hypothetical protein